MKYRYLEKAYYPGSYDLIPMEPGDLWQVEGVVRFHLPALLIDWEEHPERFVVGELSVEEYAAAASEYIPDWEEADDDDVREPVVLVEYGPDDWRVLDGWVRIRRAMELEMTTLPPALIMTDRETSMLRAGITRFRPASASAETKLATKMPSTMVYRDMNTVMTMVGIAKTRRDLAVCRCVNPLPIADETSAVIDITYYHIVFWTRSQRKNRPIYQILPGNKKICRFQNKSCIWQLILLLYKKQSIYCTEMLLKLNN